jgi:uncharacterized protein
MLKLEVLMMVYWKEKGSLNTEQTVEKALIRAGELKIGHIVVASNSGKTAALFARKGPSITCVTHHVGFTGPGVDEMEPESRLRLNEKGIKILTTTHLFAGIDRAVRNKFQGLYPSEIVATTLRMMGQGFKVCLEISVMALDAGLIPFGEEIIAVGGTGRGADTALVIMPAHSSQFFDSRVKEIICIPRDN